MALPRDDRWRALARAALRDDLYALHRELTAEVLPSRGPGIDARGRVDERRTRRRSAASRRWRTSASGGMFDLTTLPVAVREVRNLIQVPAPMPSVDVPPPRPESGAPDGDDRARPSGEA